MRMHCAGRFTVLAACILWTLAGCDSTGAPAPTPSPPAPPPPASMPVETDAIGAGIKQDVAEAKHDVEEAEQARRAAQARLKRCQQRPEICVQSSPGGEPPKEDAAH